jgi:hypothetical protein
MYHEVMILVCDAEITRYLSGRSMSSSVSTPVDVLGLHDPVVAADQLRPSKSHYRAQAQGSPPSYRPQDRQEGSPSISTPCQHQGPIN